VRTTITGLFGRDSVVTHTLEEGETWADFDCEQPNPVFSHDEAWMPHCPLCP